MNLRDDLDRERGILTPRDRRFLVGELDDELEDNQKRQKRYRLRKRMVHALQDLAYLALMETEDLARIAEEFGFPPSDEVDEEKAYYEELPDEVKEILQQRQLFNAALGEVLEFGREVSSVRSLERIMQTHLAERAALDYYEETGRFGVFEVTFDVECVDEMSISELAETAYEDPPGPTRVNAPAGAYKVLDLHGIDPPEYEPNHPDIAETVIEVIDDLADESEGAEKEQVIQEVAQREEILADTAWEAYRDTLFLGRCYEPTDTTVRTI